MRSTALLLPIVASFLLGACATGAAETSNDVFSWGSSVSAEEGAKLVLGEPETDNVVVGFYCRPGSGQVEMIDFGAPPDANAAKRVTLVSGKTRAVAAVVVEPNEMTEVHRRSELSASNPVLQAFRATGRLGLARRGAADAYSAATPAEKAAVDSFFKSCGTA